MERRQLEYFLAVVERGSVTAAATHLHVSQPTVSVSLQNLEKDLGGRLFERTATGLTLSEAGRALLEPARQVLRDLTVARESVRDVLGLTGGHLDLCAVPAVAAGWLVEVVAAFRHRHPQVVVRVQVDADDDAIAAQVRSGRHNAGLTVSDPAAPQLVSFPVGSQRLAALLPPGSPGTGVPLAVEDLADRDLITLSRGRSTSRRWLEAQLAERGASPRVGVEIESTAAVLPLVAAGAGYALWWTPMLELSVGPCVLRPISPSLERPVVLSHRRGALSPATRAFLEVVEGHLPRPGPPAP